jgi:protease-4
MNATGQQGQPSNLPSADASRTPTIIVQQAPPRRRWGTRLLMLVLIVSVAFNLMLFSAYHSYLGTGSGVVERYYSGELEATDKIALLHVEGTIMPPFTSRILKAIEQAQKDEHVKGVVLVIDSPGGLVADSNEIYRELRKLEHDNHKPINVAMKRLAASGGYYVAMGAGPDGTIFAEPTTWTGSIGVILPHYDISSLADKIGVSADALKTGEFKDTLNPFRKMTDREKKLWTDIIDDSFNRFLDIIHENRKALDLKKVKELATGQVYTAKQAQANGLIDKIGFVDDAIDALKSRLNLTRVRVVSFESPPGLFDMLTASSEAARPDTHWKALLDAAVPREYYLFTSIPGIAAP